MNLKFFQNPDRVGASLLVTIGVGVLLQGSQYAIGNLNNMGPGFVPIMLGVSFLILGLLLGLTSWLEQSEDNALSLPDRRGSLCILSGVIAFVLLGHFGGLIPATFGATFISALGDRKNGMKDAAILAAVISVASGVIFWWALRMPIALFSWGT